MADSNNGEVRNRFGTLWHAMSEEIKHLDNFSLSFSLSFFPYQYGDFFVPKGCRKARNNSHLPMDHQHRCLGMPKLYDEMPYNESIQEEGK